MILAIYFLLILFGIFVKNKFKYFDILVIAFLAYITYQATDVADFANYQTAYNWISAGNSYSDLGYGWYYLCRVGSLLCLDYRTFKTVIVVISCLIIKFSIKDFIKENKNMFWSLFLLFPALLDCVQVRFFLAEAIFLFAVRFLIKKKMRGYIVYAMFIFFASTIHSATYFLFIFLLIPFFSKIKKIIIGFVVFLSLILVFARDQVLFIAQRLLNAQRITEYFSNGIGMGFFGLLAYTSTLLLFIILSKSVFDLCNSGKNISRKDCQIFCELFEQLSLIVCAIFPMCTYDTDFFRIQRPMWMILYIVMIILMENKFQSIVFFKKTINIKLLTVVIALSGNIFYICVFNFSVISSFLL